jgi:hypothetical protein
LVYVHPALGLVSLCLLVWLATAGFRARHAAPYASGSRRLHRRLGNLVAVLFVLSAGSGLATTVFMRDDLSPATTWHAVAGAAGVALIAALYLLGTQVPRRRWARRLHPWVGIAALAAGGALFVLGVGLLP